jgi:hypothetical protein
VVATVAVLGATAGAGVAASRGDAASPAEPQLAAATQARATTSAAPRPDPATERSIERGRGVSERASRGGSRPPLASEQRATKTKALTVGQQEVSGAVTKTVVPTNPQDIARSMLPKYGWSSDQFYCLDQIYIRESGWNPSADNPYSGAYGIPQALPGDKMAAFGADWQTNPATQLAWGLSYIRGRYGSPCGAWGFWQSHNWY